MTVVHIKGTGKGGQIPKSKTLKLSLDTLREAKNAADCKLRQSIRRFADENKSPVTIILITGDVNFAPDISDLKNRKKCNVILIYPEQVQYYR